MIKLSAQQDRAAAIAIRGGKRLPATGDEGRP